MAHADTRQTANAGTGAGILVDADVHRADLLAAVAPSAALLVYVQAEGTDGGESSLGSSECPDLSLYSALVLEHCADQGREQHHCRQPDQ